MIFKTTIAEKIVLEASKLKIKDFKTLHSLKKRFSLIEKHKLVPNIELIKAYNDLVDRKVILKDDSLLKLFRKRGVRSKSGVASVTVITKNFPCPGSCIFCPNEPSMPKSYLSNEPAIMRAIMCNFDPYSQVLARLNGLKKTGHITDKIDLIISGGTFSFYPRSYQSYFVRNVYNALNYPAKKFRSISDAIKFNETAYHRCIGLSIETRPDHINKNEIKRLREFGVTKVEIGVQSLNNDVLKLNRRGHSVEESASAIMLMRDAGFKINCHMMPNLYGSSFENDLNDFKKLFDDSSFRPDWLKIYPCMVVPWSILQQVYEKGDYKPYSDEELTELIINIKQLIPRYTRVTRLYRDIPANTILAGSKMSNLRQIVHKEMNSRGIKCDCIRCREIKDENILEDQVELRIKEFDASNGKEFFISFDDKKRDLLCALLRLRFSSYSLSGKKHFIKELDGASIIREVHTYGEQVKISSSSKGESQHIGFGKRLIMEAENISRANGFKKIAVISGVGVREYYKKLGYKLEGTYMVKYI